MPASVPPPSKPRSDFPEEHVPMVTRFGSVVGAAVVASALASGPAALRVSAAVSGGPAAWPALAAALLLPMIVAVALLRRARVGFRAFARPEPGTRALGLSLWTALFLTSVTALGAMLRATTHHHALAAVTFALTTAILAVLVARFSARLAAILSDWVVRKKSVRLLAAGAFALASLAFVVAALTRWSPALSVAACANVVDLLAFAMAALLASRPDVSTRRAFALFGPPVAAALLALGMTTLRASAPLASAIGERAPAFEPAVRALFLK